jgi:steroid delta-isomerase-like uncharacterized protein
MDTKEELEKLKAQKKIEEQNKASVFEWLEEWDKENFDIEDKVIADNFIFHMPGGVDIKGAKEFIKAGEPFRNGFPGFKHTVEEAFAKGDRVVVRFKNQCTHKGEFMGIPSTGKEIQYTAIAIYKFKDGKCVEGWVDLDFLGMMQQLGMELKMKEENE